jgi:hypothetical protein
MYQSAELQRAELTRDRCYKVPNEPMCRQPTNCRTTPPYWAALFSDNYPLRGVLRLG